VILRAGASLLLAWLLGFVVFAALLPQPHDGDPTDAVVVPTGGAGRIERGLALIRTKQAKRMLVTGVPVSVRPKELAAQNDAPLALFECCVDLGREAVDTRSNAEETARWVKKHRFRSVRLVTTDWHMRRARFELERALDPDVRVVSDSVASVPDLTMLLREYNKYLLRRASALVGI